MKIDLKISYQTEQLFGIQLCGVQTMNLSGLDKLDSKGLYQAEYEKDACGIGLVTAGKAGPSHDIVESAIAILKNLSHRSAQGADGKTSDGAGILVQIPFKFFSQQPGLENLPKHYAVGVLFMSQRSEERAVQEESFAKIAALQQLKILGWRTVPVDSTVLGDQARSIEPVVRQVFIETSDLQEREIKRRLFFLQQESEHQTGFYLASLSTTTMVYKGLVLPEHLAEYYVDLKDPNFISALAMVHSRFSTNTLPAWRLAQPFRMLCHNGEINTIRGNLNWMKARENDLIKELDPQNSVALSPLFAAGRSDSCSLDLAANILHEDGRSLPHAMMMLMPEPWEKNPQLSPELKAFYAFHATRLEPWDGPAAVCFTDGRWIGATLDRNGLRPCRYLVLDDDSIVLSSETGVLPIPKHRIVRQGRVKPGQMLAVDTQDNRIYEGNAIRQEIAESHPYQAWVDQEQIKLPANAASKNAAFEKASAERPAACQPEKNKNEILNIGWTKPLLKRLLEFGFTYEEIQTVMIPMFRDGEEANSSMGNDTPLAVLSDHPQLLFKYFRQMFAQVTNPPIDPIREQLVMSLTTYLGPRSELFSKQQDGHLRIRLQQPVLSYDEMKALIENPAKDFANPIKTARIKIAMSGSSHENRTNSSHTLEQALEKICQLAHSAVQEGVGLLILSDQDLLDGEMAIPSLLAVSAVHHSLIRCGLRLKASLLLETADARDVHHFACLIGFGADAVFPYLVSEMAKQLNSPTAEKKYLSAIHKGLLKIMSKMGISTLQSYCGAQIFEILGLSSQVVDAHFPNTPTRIGGLSLQTIGEEVVRRYELASKLQPQMTTYSDLPNLGDVHYRSQGEAHLWTPEAIAKLQEATRTSNAKTFAEFSAEIERNSRFTLRGHLHLRPRSPSIPLSEVEPVTAVMRRFTTGAMSFGALSQEAHETLAIAMNRVGAKSNSGEGGEDSDRFLPMKNGDSKNSAIKQVASGRFGVTAHYLAHAQELQIKVAQGAKPGEGGQLPGSKVDETIAKLRFSTPGVTLISPPPHHDIYSIEDLSQLIFDLKNSNPEAVVSVKLVSEAGVGTIAAGVAKAHAEKIVISGDSGGTGASPLSSIKYAGAPWELGLAEAHQTLVRNGLRSRVTLETDGQLKTGRDVAIAALLGAEEFGFSTAPLIVEGCVMMRKCHLNTCPVGVATQDPILRAKFKGQPEHVIQYFHFVAEELRKIMAELGFRTVLEMVGRTDCLESIAPAGHWKAHSLDLSKLLAPAESRVPGVPTTLHYVGLKDTRIDQVLDQKFVTQTSGTLNSLAPIEIAAPVQNTDRAVGTLLSHAVVKRYGMTGLPTDTIKLNLQGTAGQSLGAFLAHGISIKLIGDANDYVGKGLSGGRISIALPKEGNQLSSEDKPAPIIVGNTCLYGATSGEFFAAGAAGERFAVRNSGAIAVIEGTGDHACEYMTGGRVVVLGSTGANFAAGMSGGIAYVYDETGTFANYCNLSSVSLGPVDQADEREFLLKFLQKHVRETNSIRGLRILNSWRTSISLFVRVMPLEYQNILNHAKGSSSKSNLLTQREIMA